MIVSVLYLLCFVSNIDDNSSTLTLREFSLFLKYLNLQRGKVIIFWDLKLQNPLIGKSKNIFFLMILLISLCTANEKDIFSTNTRVFQEIYFEVYYISIVGNSTVAVGRDLTMDSYSNHQNKTKMKNTIFRDFAKFSRYRV